MKKKLSLDQVKETALQLLIYVDRICEENDLKYSLYYGTLLGAVRHKGFIPWDDDIDIVMLRPDYDKLLSILAKDETYLLLDQSTRPDYRYTFAKLVDSNTYLESTQFYSGEDPELGVFLDIFPLDGVPENQEELVLYRNELNQDKAGIMYTIKDMYARSFNKYRSLLKKVVKKPQQLKFLKEGDYSYWRAKYEADAKRYPVTSSKYCAHVEFIETDKKIYPTEWFYKFKKIDFEGYQFQSIQADDEFLTSYFGNYMELPPIEEQKSNHPYIAYYKEYKEEEK